jgi:hypothetical protein
MIQKGDIYRHFKGGLYKVLEIAKHSETKEPFVVYININNENDIWIRPEKMFLENITKNGQTFPRFELISETDGKVNKETLVEV